MDDDVHLRLHLWIQLGRLLVNPAELENTCNHALAGGLQREWLSAEGFGYQ